MAVDLNNGALTQVATGLIYPWGLILSSDETTAYVTSYYTGKLMSVDLNSGIVTDVTAGFSAPRGVDINPLQCR